jgi:hypothetical protein
MYHDTLFHALFLDRLQCTANRGRTVEAPQSVSRGQRPCIKVVSYVSNNGMPLCSNVTS